MSYSTPFRPGLRSDTTTYYHLVETRISYDDITGKRIVESEATYLTEEQQEQARLLAESASRVKKVSSPVIKQAARTTASKDPLKSLSLLSTDDQQSLHQTGEESNVNKDARPKPPKASPGLLSSLFHTVLASNKESQPTHSTQPIEPLVDNWTLVDSSSSSVEALSSDSSDVETLSDDDIGSVNEDSNGLYPLGPPDVSVITSSRSSGSSSPRSLSDPVDASNNHPLMPTGDDLSTALPQEQNQILQPLSTQHQPPRQMAADTSAENARNASPGFFHGIYNTLFGANRGTQPSSAKQIQPLEDIGTELKTISSNSSSLVPTSVALGEFVDATHNHPLMAEGFVSRPYQIIDSYSPRSQGASVVENQPLAQDSTVVSSPTTLPLVQNTTISSTTSPSTANATNGAQAALLQPQPPLSPVVPTDSTIQLPPRQLRTLPLVTDASEDFSTAPKIQPPRRRLPQLLPSPSEPSDQILPVLQAHTAAVSNNSSPGEQLAPVVLERMLPERPPLVLDSSLNADQIARIDQYNLQPLVPELSDEELAQLPPQKLMTRALNARQEPSMLREAIGDLQSMLEELAELKDLIAAAQREAQSQPLTIAQIRKNAENIGLSKARMLLILNRIYPGRDSDELKTIAENECVALAQKYIILAQDRLQELAVRNSVPVKTATVVIQDPVAIKLASLRKQLKLTTGSIGTATGSLGRAKRAIIPLQKKIVKLQEELNAIMANGNHEQLEATLSKFNTEEKLLEEKVNEVPAQEKKIEALQAKKAKLEREIAELEATQSSSVQSDTNI